MRVNMPRIDWERFGDVITQNLSRTARRVAQAAPRVNSALMRQGMSPGGERQSVIYRTGEMSTPAKWRIDEITPRIFRVRVPRSRDGVVTILRKHGGPGRRGLGLVGITKGMRKQLRGGSKRAISSARKVLRG